jgi:hypothetical protein
MTPGSMHRLMPIETSSKIFIFILDANEQIPLQGKKEYNQPQPLGPEAEKDKDANKQTKYTCKSPENQRLPNAKASEHRSRCLA